MKTPISYYGGKQTLLKHILPLIPDHKLYTEAFCGGCAVLFAKAPAECEVINDINTELVNFYKVAKTRYPELKTLVDASLHSREEHAHARHIYEHPSYFSPVQRAWAVWICTKLGFASMIDGTFGYDRNGTTTAKLRNAKDQFTTELCARLDNDQRRTAHFRVATFLQHPLLSARGLVPNPYWCKQTHLSKPPPKSPSSLPAPRSPPPQKKN